MLKLTDVLLNSKTNLKSIVRLTTIYQILILKIAYCSIQNRWKEKRRDICQGSCSERNRRQRNNLSIRVQNTFTRDVTLCRLRRHRWEYNLFLFLSHARAYMRARACTQNGRQYHRSDLVFTRVVLLKKKLLKTTTLNAPGLSRVRQWRVLFFSTSFRALFFSIFRPPCTRWSLFRRLLSRRDSSGEFIVVASLDQRETLA